MFAFYSQISILGCKKSVSVKEGPDAPSYLSPEVDEVVISIPSTSSYYSNSTELEISGLCGNGHMVQLTGDASDSVLCKNNIFSFKIEKSEDGLYNFYLTQTYKGSTSKPTALAWQRKTSVPPPDLTYPPASIHKSSEAILNIQGNCESGSNIALSGDGIGTTTCQNSTFNLALPKFSDGDYNVFVTQKDLAGNSSVISFLWEKRTLGVSPSNPTIIATQEQVFNPNGGSDSYTLVLSENNSGATFDSVTNTYTAGTLAGVVDKITLTDSLGVSIEIMIQVSADLPDHFVLPIDSGEAQQQMIGQNYTQPIKVQVVDQFGNGVSAFPVIFGLKAGDLHLLSPSAQTTDTQGYASVHIKQGYKASNSVLTVVPAGAPLPDNAGSGQAIISLGVLGNTNNTGNFDLNFSTGNNPDNMVMTDFNEDGEIDIAVLNKGDPSIGILLGQNSALFGSQTKITGICAVPLAMVSGDFNEDSHEDLLMSCSNKYSFFAGVGDGTFAPSVDTALDANENTPVDIATGDINGDGHLDTAIASVVNNVIAIRLGIGDGSFNTPAFLVTGAGTSPSRVAIGDIDKSNDVDLVVVNSAQDSVGLFLSNGLGGFDPMSTYSTGVAPADLILVDYNNDSYLDISTTNNIDNNVSILLNDQTGGMNLSIDTLVGMGPTSHFANDIDNDGNMDLIVTNAIDNNASVLLGFGNGTFNVQAPIPSASNPLDVIIKETNGDAFDDIVLLANGEKKIQILPVQMGGVIGYKSPAGNGPKDVVVGDFDGDGYFDQAIVNSGDNNIYILRGNGTGLFSLFATVGTSTGPIAIEKADLDADNDWDLIVANQGVNSVQVFINDGAGSFAGPVTYGSGSQPSSLQFNDFNKDGIVDMVIANSGANTISFFPGIGDGTFGLRSDTSTGSQPSQIASADMNQDGILDLIVSHQSANDVGIYFGNGDGSFQAPSTYGTQTGPNGVVVGFFNSDLNVDVAVSNNLSASVSVFFGSANGTLGAPVHYSAGADPTSVRIADVNGDDNEDLIVGNGLNQQATVLLGSFFGDFSITKILPTNINTVDVEVTDINNDGAIDLLFLDGTNNQSKVMLGL